MCGHWTIIATTFLGAFAAIGRFDQGGSAIVDILIFPDDGIVDKLCFQVDDHRRLLEPHIIGGEEGLASFTPLSGL